MPRSTIEEQKYLRRRAEQHLRQADASQTSADRSVHERFAALYEQRAVALEVQED